MRLASMVFTPVIAISFASCSVAEFDQTKILMNELPAHSHVSARGIFLRTPQENEAVAEKRAPNFNLAELKKGDTLNNWPKISWAILGCRKLHSSGGNITSILCLKLMSS
ncbi:secreted RxLR effector peptide protein, putative [Phytophthora infestans T30-4]|uniref:Secreted RxLR effector peptide protein, putative n=1 Tax=Phytophthora infestans (strain T30-4) TaxID=403677 RepID=D0NVS1_PHYIT|nr:secreted RxLR effector peptide protein, putative [Phytophthora infestans T30-4]EEY66752.1 secreted RxLR effector peptide protein, putative [Phytophthora infestans T30-4]|eukprot:XP_002896817.1 secreted RxLR effector peptide protein, putative [Phytophthora infestans T30-4]